MIEEAERSVSSISRQPLIVVGVGRQPFTCVFSCAHAPHLRQIKHDTTSKGAESLTPFAANVVSDSITHEVRTRGRISNLLLPYRVTLLVCQRRRLRYHTPPQERCSKLDDRLHPQQKRECWCRTDWRLTRVATKHTAAVDIV